MTKIIFTLYLSIPPSYPSASPTPLKQYSGVGEAGPKNKGEAENCVFNQLEWIF